MKTSPKDKERRDEIKITANYSFWRHPIKWIKERKLRKIMQTYANIQWRNGMKDEIYKRQEDMIFHGTAIMKHGKRVDPLKFKPKNK